MQNMPEWRKGPPCRNHPHDAQERNQPEPEGLTPSPATHKRTEHGCQAGETNDSDVAVQLRDVVTHEEIGLMEHADSTKEIGDRQKDGSIQREGTRTEEPIAQTGSLR